MQAAQMRSWPTRQDANGDLNIEVPTESGRTQVVTISMGKDGDQDVAGFVWSKAGELRASLDPWALLRLNAELTYGKCAVRGNDIVILHGIYDAAAQIADVGKAIYWVGRSADELEKSTYGAGADVL
jgi:hypothetical protein